MTTSRTALEAADTTPSLSEALRALAKPGALDAAAGQRIACLACAHRCVLADGHTGACGVRFVEGSRIHAPFGYVARSYVRPVETNTIYHLLPGALALTFGMYGCDLKCPYCHNARVSQALRASVVGETPRIVSATALAEEAVEAGAQVVCAAYNEPMIAAEWVHAVFEAAKRRGLRTAIVSDGHTTPEALAYLRPVADVFRVDYKAATDRDYRTLGGRLEPVVASIAEARQLGYWVEVVTLVVPGFNDESWSLHAIARTIAAIDRAIPWHVNAFQPRYRMLTRPPTAPRALIEAAALGLGAGLAHVYAGNVSNQLDHLEHTRCPSCAEVLVRRHDYRTLDVRLRDGACGSCRTPIPGVWSR